MTVGICASCVLIYMCVRLSERLREPGRPEKHRFVFCCSSPFVGCAISPVSFISTCVHMCVLEREFRPIYLFAGPSMFVDTRNCCTYVIFYTVNKLSYFNFDTALHAVSCVRAGVHVCTWSAGVNTDVNA